jgi:hypothetical protein
VIPFPIASVVIDGKLVASSRPAYVQSGTIMAPIEPFALQFATEVSAGPSGQITIRRGPLWVSFLPGEPVAHADGQIRTLPIAPSLRDGAVFIPLAAVVRSLDMTIRYVPESRVAYVSTGRPEPLQTMAPAIPRVPPLAPGEVFTEQPKTQPQPVFTGIPRARRTPIEAGRLPF